MNLIIDIGNSRTKLAVCKNDTFIELLQIESDNLNLFQEHINNLTTSFYEIKNVIVSIVRKESDFFSEFLKNKLKEIIFLSEKTKIPIKNLYKTPEKLGKDRLAAVVGANFLFPERDVLVFDAGTALTIDFINKNGEYFGGNISPGLTLRYKALNYFTGNLPLLQADINFETLSGDSTNTAIQAGVQNGIIFECRSYIEEYSKKYENLKVIFTGGDTNFFANRLKKNIFAEENLVLIGLNKILQYNVG